MSSLVQLGKFGAINASYPTTMGYYMMKYISEPYTLQEDRTTYGQVSKAVQLVHKSEYLSINKAKTNWCRQRYGTNKSIIISTCTISYPCLEVSVINNVA